MEGFLNEYLKYSPDNRPQLYSDSKYCNDYFLGRGSFGEVFKAHDENGKSVVIKKMCIDRKEMEISALRESLILMKLTHPNIVPLIEVLISGPMDGKPCIFLVLEFCKSDLYHYLQFSVNVSTNNIKKMMRQLVSAVSFMHANRFLHRDIKPENILIDESGNLKLADFGMARPFRGENEGLSTNVGTLWYKAPEILLDDNCYGPAIDIWSVGCVFAELWTREAIFRGYCEFDQIDQIRDYCGPFTSTVWPGIEELNGYRQLYAIPRSQRRIKDMLEMEISDPQAFDLLDRMLVLDPLKRISGLEALEHSFLKEDRDLIGQNEIRPHHEDFSLPICALI